jgi:hypothetical protein
MYRYIHTHILIYPLFFLIKPFVILVTFHPINATWEASIATTDTGASSRAWRRCRAQIRPRQQRFWRWVVTMGHCWDSVAADGSGVYSNNRNNSHTKMDMMIIVTNYCILLLVCCFLTSTRWIVYYFACLPWVRIASSKLVSHLYRMHPSRGEGGLKRSGKSRSQLNLEFTSSLSTSIFTVISHSNFRRYPEFACFQPWKRCLKMGYPIPSTAQSSFSIPHCWTNPNIIWSCLYIPLYPIYICIPMFG